MNSDNPSYECAAYLAMSPDWEIVNDVYIGTRRIREGREKYLPKSPAEEKADYDARLAQATFWNADKRTIEGLTGMTFRKSPKFASDVPAIIGSNEKGEESDAENIDLMGSHFDVFTKKVFKTALIDGHTFVLVDMPPPVTVDNPNATAADEIGRRPYWVHVKANQIVNWDTGVENGKTVLTQVSIKECVKLSTGRFTQKEITQYRVLTRGAWEVWRKAKDVSADSTSDEFVLYESGVSLAPNGEPLTVIPLAPVYANQTGYFTSQPPLLDLAWENLRHYRLQSDLDNILHVANVPIGWIKGRVIKRDAQGNELPPKIGPNTWLDLTTDTNAGVGYSEHNGSAIGAAQTEIDKSRGNMAALGLLLLSQKAQVQKSATESALDNEAESSELAGMVRGLEDGVEAALGYHAMFRGLESGGSVAFNKDFTRVQLDAQKIQVYANMVAVGDMSLETLYWMLEQAEELPPDFKADDEIARLKAEKADAEKRSMEVLKARPQFMPNGAQDNGASGQVMQ